jgi:CcmD family protein
MRHLRLLVLTAVLASAGGALLLPPSTTAVVAQNRTPPAAQDEFVPIDELPPQEQVPAAPLVVAAYSFVWVAFLAYVLSLVKRVRKVETDLSALERNRR